MTLFLNQKHSILALLVLLPVSYANLAQAENGGYYAPPSYNQSPQGYGGYPNQQNSGYSAPWNNQGSSFSGPWNNRGSGFSGPWNNSGSGFNSPWNNNGSGFSSPWNNNSSGFSSPWNNNSSGFSGPWNNSGSGFSGPWNNRGSNSGPWNNGGWGNGGRNPFGPRSPDQWMNPNKNDMSNNWDDMLNAPSRMGRMPGGWNAPSVSVPNPIDVGDEFNDAARDMPDQMDNFRYNR